MDRQLKCHGRQRRAGAGDENLFTGRGSKCRVGKKKWKVHFLKNCTFGLNTNLKAHVAVR